MAVSDPGEAEPARAEAEAETATDVRSTAAVSFAPPPRQAARDSATAGSGISNHSISEYSKVRVPLSFEILTYKLIFTNVNLHPQP